MGSWNKTCGLSNLHIKHGERAYVFVLEKAEDSSRCYTTHMYKPLLLPFESTYNDYGGGEDSSGKAFELVMHGVKKHLVEMEVGENKYHDIAVNKEGFDEQMFFEAVHEGRLFKKGPFDSEATQIEFVMFRKDVVDYILENRKIEEYVGNGQGTCGWNNNYVRYNFKDIIADIRPLLDAAMQELNNCDKDDRAFKTNSGFEYMDVQKLDNKVVKWLRGDSYRYSRIVDVKRTIGRALEIGTLESINTLEALLVEHLKAIFIDAFMHETRKSWYPAGHEGSQGQEHSGHRLLIKATSAVLDKEKAEWEAENEGEFE